LEIVPDEIFVNIELQEYQKKGESKKDLETLKRQFLESAKATGIPDSTISIVSYSGNNDYYHLKKRKKSDDLSASIVYQIKFSSSRAMDNLVEKLDDEATKNFTIVSVSHSKITEYRRDLKIKAIKAARDKGLYLTEAIGEKLGEAITINEPGEWAATGNGENFLANATSNGLNATYYERDQPAGPATEVDFKKVKLRFEVMVVFALK
jgi:hypothetical protein